MPRRGRRSLRAIHRPLTRAHTRPIESHAKAAALARAALERHAEDVVILDLRALSSVTDFFVLCTAASARQINALREHLEGALRQHGAAVWHTEGVARAEPEAPQWVLMDCGDVVVHLFDHRARAFYGLERLWADAPRVSPTWKRLSVG